MTHAVRRFLAAVAGGLVLTLLAGATWIARGRPASTRPTRTVSDSLFHLGLERELHLDYMGAYAAYHAALERDPTYLGAVAQLFLLGPEPPLSLLAFVDSLAARQSDADLGRGLHRVASADRGILPPPQGRAPTTAIARDCETLYAWRYNGTRPATPDH